MITSRVGCAKLLLVLNALALPTLASAAAAAANDAAIVEQKKANRTPEAKPVNDQTRQCRIDLGLLLEWMFALALPVMVRKAF
jgi:hypothetical protein